MTRHTPPRDFMPLTAAEQQQVRQNIVDRRRALFDEEPVRLSTVGAICVGALVLAIGVPAFFAWLWVWP